MKIATALLGFLLVMLPTAANARPTTVNHHDRCHTSYGCVMTPVRACPAPMTSAKTRMHCNPWRLVRHAH